MGLNNFFFIVQFVILFIFLSVLQIIRSKWLLENIGRVQIFILLFYSYYFVGSVNWRFAVCVALVTIIAYGGGQLIERAKQLGNSYPRIF